MSATDELVPTAKLRFVEREMTTPIDGKTARVQVLKILQQYWSNAPLVKMGPTHMIKGEWRDVPVEKE